MIYEKIGDFDQSLSLCASILNDLNKTDYTIQLSFYMLQAIILLDIYTQKHMTSEVFLFVLFTI